MDKLGLMVNIRNIVNEMAPTPPDFRKPDSRRTCNGFSNDASLSENLLT